ncbi:MAG: tRNA uridine-5-carboxymethylaminomethyl(34) synthesis GTPase MnmE, partial [Candidatus Omnitrophica bacterium]|nr:tRNA uridine-5-carboxymethylaminomethyl(34) synthesis GTPase MnmE [Candidatus Omnitrophota bacterium]
EDVVEINCHSGIAPLKKILDLVLINGARLAQPGEFTKRAFLNGKMDLSQAEAVADIIKAETDISCKVAARQLMGVFSEEISGLRDLIINILSSIELTIDFSAEDVEFPDAGGIIQRIDDTYASVKEILATSGKGMLLREGADVVICGKPNVGKSSLMNALLQHDRVIVTPIAGTTRDVIEETINISGVKVRLSDTAGIIETRDRVEIEGIKRSREKLKSADLAVFMLDSSQDLSEQDEGIFETIKGKELVVVMNKIDLPCRMDATDLKKRFGEEILKVSALKKEGICDVEDAVARKLFKGDVNIPEGALLTNARHKVLVENAAGALARALKGAKEKYNGELLASDLKIAIHQLGLVIGESIEDDVLDRIFSEFCIGK